MLRPSDKKRGARDERRSKCWSDEDMVAPTKSAETSCGHREGKSEAKMRAEEAEGGSHAGGGKAADMMGIRVAFRNILSDSSVAPTASASAGAIRAMD